MRSKAPGVQKMAMAAVEDRSEGREMMTVTQLAEQLGVTARAIRFYEDKGLIAPSRAGTTRVYTRREQARMKLILRGKRLGFSLRDIREFLDLYDADTTQRVQMRRLLERIRVRAAALRDQQAAITETLAELAQLAQQARAILAAGARKAAEPAANKDG